MYFSPESGRYPVPDDSILIKQTNFALHAAGIKASVVSQSQLLVSAPIIFVKVFEGIYGNHLRGINYSPSSREDHIRNMDIVVGALQNRYHFHALSLVSGELIVDGDIASISTVVGIFYGHTSSSGKFDGVSPEVLQPQIYETKRQDIIPGELRTIVDRVSFLRNKLDIIDPPAKSTKSELKSGKKRGKKKKLATSNTTDDILSRSPAEEMPENRRHSSADMHKKNEDGISSDGNKSSRSPTANGQSRRGRPVSASSVSVKKMNGHTDRPETTPTTVTRKMAFGRSVSKAGQTLPTFQESNNRQSDPNYTYDTATGRRVLVGELEALQRQRQRQLERGIIGKTTLAAQSVRTVPELKAIEEKRVKDALHAPVESTTSAFPGHRTEQSVEVFNSKMKNFREPEEEDPFAYLKNPVTLSAYQSLEPMDILVSVEHCHHCEHHPLTLRHDTDVYISQANDIMDHLLGALHAARPCARVGAVRVPADITPKSRSTDKKSRIGALEVQVAYFNKNTSSVTAEVLHSKLKTRRWPSKSVLEKRMLTFLSKHHVPTVHNTAGVADEYPSLELCVSEPHIIGWVFDAKDVVRYSSLKVDALVRVSHAPNGFGSGVEKYSKEGKVVGVFRSKSTGQEMGRILLKYNTEPVECAAADCTPLSEPDSNPAIAPADLSECTIPECLRIVLDYAVNTNSAQWQIMCPEDVSLRNVKGDNDLFLCRHSFYLQMHKLVWKCIVENPGDVEGTMAYQSSPSEPSQCVDVQLAYSEPVLSWVFDKFGKVVNMSALVHLAQTTSETLAQQIGSNSDTSDKKKELEDMPSSNVSSGDIDVNLSTERSLTEEEKEEKAKAVKKEAKESVLQSITNVVGSSSDDKEEASGKVYSEGGLKPSASAAEIIISLRSRIRDVCLALKSDEEGATKGEDENVSIRGDLIASSPYRWGAKKLFDAFDEDSVGELNMKQFNEALLKFGIEVDDNDLRKLWASLDIDGNSHISQTEFLAFLNVEMKVGYRELGEIWDCIRKASGAPALGLEDDINDQSTTPSMLENMEKDMFSLCSLREGENVVSAEMFVQILQKFDIYEHLKIEDVNLLVLYFGVDNTTNQSVPDAILESGDKGVDLEKYDIKFDDFFSWLQPVDFVKVCRRISRFLKALSKHEGGMGDTSGSENVVASGKHTIGHSGDIDGYSKVSRVEHTSIPIDTPAFIRLKRCDTNTLTIGKFEFTSDRDSDKSFVIKATRVDATEEWEHDVEVEWEIVRTEENVAGIPISAIDPNKTGFISKSHFSSYVDSMGLTITPAELRSLYRNFGSDDGLTMSYDNLNQLIECNYVTHKFVPVIGSRMYRKKSIMGPAADLESLQQDQVEEAPAVPRTLHHGIDSLELRIGLVEMIGEVLDTQEMSSVMLEIKYLLQDLRVVVDSGSRQGAGKRFVDELDWDPIMLTTSALRMNADICVALRAPTGKNKLLGKTFFSPHSVIDHARDGSHDEALEVALSTGAIVKVILHMRVRESGSRLSQMMSRAYDRETSMDKSAPSAVVQKNGCTYEVTHVTVKNASSTHLHIAVKIAISREDELSAGCSMEPKNSKMFIGDQVLACTVCSVPSPRDKLTTSMSLEFDVFEMSYDSLLASTVEIEYGGDPEHCRLPVNIHESEHLRRSSIRSETEALEEAEKLVMGGADNGDEEDDELYPNDYELSDDPDDGDVDTSFLEHFE